LISTFLSTNIYDKPDTALFDADGKLVADASILPLYGEDLNWFKPYERLGQRSDYNLSGRTGSEKNSLYFSLGYLNEKGYIKFSDFKRFSGRINADLQATKWLKYGFNMAGTYQKSNNTPAGAANVGSQVNPIAFSRNMAPIYPVHLHTPGTGEYVLDALDNKRYDDGAISRPQAGSVGRHAIWENEMNKDQFFRTTLMGQAYANITFLKHFAFNIVADINSRSDEEQTYNNAIIGDGVGSGRGARNNYRYLNYTARQSFSYNNTFNGVHNVEVMAGHENFNYDANYLFAYKTSEIAPGGIQLTNFTSITSLYDVKDVYRTEGYFSRVRYSYDDKYFFDASFRRDGTSKFNQKWGNFFSVGGSWTISKERFFDPLANKINFLKIRTSYGEVGNDGGTGIGTGFLSFYASQALYDLNQNASLGAVYRSQFENNDLIWEKSASIGAALEGRIFNRANFTVEYFDKQSINLIFNRNLPLSAGSTSTSNAESVKIENIGSVSNRGWEFTFDVDVIRTKDFTFNFGLNATLLKNEVKTLPDANKANGIINGTKKIMEGHSIYDYWLPQFAGVDQMTGNALYVADTVTVPAQFLVTINGKNYSTNATYAERNWSGSAIPDVFGSFATNFRYKNITLGAVFTYALGGKIYDNSYISLMTMGGAPNGLHKDLLKAWDGVPKDMTATSENRIDSKGIPVVDFYRSQFNNAASTTRWLHDASYLVFKNVNLSYKLPTQLSSKLQLKSLRVGVSAENLFNATKLRGMNPQQNFNGISDNIFVTPRVVSFLLNVGL
jgi:TonB-linked SusC/RagA family outer membrane protein